MNLLFCVQRLRLLFYVFLAAAATDLLPLLLKNDHLMSTYDIMLYYWLDHKDYRFFELHPLLYVPIFNVIYSILSALFTFLTHYFILRHLMNCYVNIPDVTETIRNRRYHQNVSNFKRSIASTCFRFVMTFPMFLTSLFPIDFLQHTEGILVYLSLHLVSSIYESCGPSFTYLSNRTVFEREKNMVGPSEDNKKITVHTRGGNFTVGPTVFHSDSSMECKRTEKNTLDGNAAAKPSNRRLDQLKRSEEPVRSSSRLSQNSAKKMIKKWKSKATTVNPVQLDPSKLPKVKFRQPVQQNEVVQNVVKSRYCKMHFDEKLESTPTLKRAQTKLYVLKRGKVQEQTEDEVGWMYYDKEKNKVYMKNAGAMQCPKCKPKNSSLSKRRERRKSKLVNQLSHPCPQSSSVNKHILDLNVNVFSDRNSDSGVTEHPSTRLIFKDFETG